MGKMLIFFIFYFPLHSAPLPCIASFPDVSSSVVIVLIPVVHILLTFSSLSLGALLALSPIFSTSSPTSLLSSMFF